MNGFNFILLGGFDLARELGKKGTTSDISIYDRKEGDTIMTWCIPMTYPDKIQSLVVAINIAEYAILNVSRLHKYLGEQIIALDTKGTYLYLCNYLSLSWKMSNLYVMTIKIQYLF